MSRRSASALLVSLIAVAVAGCESSQDRSAQLQKQGANLIQGQHGLVIHGENRSVRVLQAGVVTDANGTAAALLLRNQASTPVSSVPIAIEVLGPGRKRVFANSAPGLEASLTSLSSLPPRREVTWVNDQVIPTGKPIAVQAKVGAGGTSAPSPIPRIDVGPAHLHDDPTSGLEATGSVTNRSTVDQARLFVYLSAWRGGRLLAAGRGAVARLGARAHVTYHVFLIGNPHGAPLTAAAPPTVLR